MKLIIFYINYAQYTFLASFPSWPHILRTLFILEFNFVCYITLPSLNTRKKIMTGNSGEFYSLK